MNSSATSFRHAYDHLVRKIASGDLPAGAVLSEAPLAAEIGVSRTPIREAIGQLAAEGIVHKVAHRGTVVAEPTREDIIELYELREALETYAVIRATRRGIPPSELAVLSQLVEEVANVREALLASGLETLSGELLQRFLAADLRFHSSLLQASGNRRMSKVFGGTRLLIRIFTMRRQWHTANLLEAVYGFHRGILDAVARGDEPSASRLLGEHIQSSLKERLVEYEAAWRAAEQSNHLGGL